MASAGLLRAPSSHTFSEAWISASISGAELRGDVAGAMAQEQFVILEPAAGGSQPMTVRVLQIVHPNGLKSRRTGSPELACIAVRGTTTRGFPPRVIDPRDGFPSTREHELRMHSTAAIDHEF